MSLEFRGTVIRIGETWGITVVAAHDIGVAMQYPTGGHLARNFETTWRHDLVQGHAAFRIDPLKVDWFRGFSEVATRRGKSDFLWLTQKGVDVVLALIRKDRDKDKAAGKKLDAEIRGLHVDEFQKWFNKVRKGFR